MNSKLLWTCAALSFLAGCAPSLPRGTQVIDRSSWIAGTRPSVSTPPKTNSANPLPAGNRYTNQGNSVANNVIPNDIIPSNPIPNATLDASNSNGMSNSSSSSYIPPAPTTSPSNVSVTTLLENAQASISNNNLEAAASSLQQALQIEPQNATIWHDLANIRLHQGNYQQAITLANKSVNFAKGNQALLTRNNTLIQAALARKSN